MTTRRKTRNRRNKKEEVEEDFNPNPDLRDINYEEECTSVRIIIPMSFDDSPKKPETVKEKNRAEGSVKKKDKEKNRAEGSVKKKKRKQDDPTKVEVGEKKKKDKNRAEGSVKKEKEDKKFEISTNSTKLSPIDFKDIIVISMSVGSKKGHPWESRITGNHCLVANGKPGCPLQLKKGKKYLFKFIGKEGSGYELLLTRSPAGGASASCLEGTLPIGIGKDGLVTLNDKCPSVIYYQDRHREYVGGIINIS